MFGIATVLMFGLDAKLALIAVVFLPLVSVAFA